MITFLIIFSTIVILSLLGMFYWMYKAKKGELDLRKSSWHMRYMNYLWDVEPYDAKNSCPYYWSLVSSLLLTPIYFLVKYLYLSCEYVYEKFLSKVNINIPEFVKLPVITKESIFKKLYKKSQIYLKLGALSILIIVGLIALFELLKNIFIVDLLAFKIVISTILILALCIIQIIKKPEWDKYFLDPVIDFFKSLLNLILIPFKILGAIFSYLGEVIFKVYKNNCPPINWI